MSEGVGEGGNALLVFAREGEHFYRAHISHRPVKPALVFRRVSLSLSVGKKSCFLWEYDIAGVGESEKKEDSIDEVFSYFFLVHF